jgi:hypothetical protein
MRSIFIIGIILLNAYSTFAQSPRELSLESKSKVNLELELRNFVETLKNNDSRISKKYAKFLTKNADEDSFGTDDLQVIKWQVIKSVHSEENGLSKDDSETIYLVTQGLFDSKPNEYKLDHHIAFVIRVHEIENRQRENENSYLFIGEKLSLKFEKIILLKSDWI